MPLLGMLLSIFSECKELLTVLFAVPVSTAGSELCFSILKPINTFLRNNVDQERLCVLVMVSIEKEREGWNSTTKGFKYPADSLAKLEISISDTQKNEYDEKQNFY